VLLHLTQAGLYAAQRADGAAAGAEGAVESIEAASGPNGAHAAGSGPYTGPTPRTLRSGTKQARR
jgi:hypothetical protein